MENCSMALFNRELVIKACQFYLDNIDRWKILERIKAKDECKVFLKLPFGLIIYRTDEKAEQYIKRWEEGYYRFPPKWKYMGYDKEEEYREVLSLKYLAIHTKAKEVYISSKDAWIINEYNNYIESNSDGR